MNLITIKTNDTVLTSFVCMSNANNKSLFSKTQKNAKRKNTIAIGEK
jgi:hypothetical protein